MVTAGVAGTIEQGGQETPFIDTLLKFIVIPPFGCVRVKRLAQSLPVLSCQVQVIVEPIASHWFMLGAMATNTYGNLCLGSRCMGMVLKNLSAWEVWAIRPFNSPWASAAVLCHEKEWKALFLYWPAKFNSLTVKDVYSIPRIQDTLDCFQGAVWFTLLDLKSKYWQVEL